ncbi:nuclear transport factor 2 family protein [Nocardioides pacificus]
MDAPTLDERVAALEAIEQIRTLKHRYLRACDAKRPDEFRECFVAEGASIDYGPRIGRFDDADAIAAVFAAIALKQVDGRHVVLDMHHAGHPVIELTGPESAVGAWSLRMRQVDLERKVERVSAIEYDDRYEVEGGAWRIRSSAVRVLWTLAQPLADGFTIEESFS